jgi:hypothetical protein
MIVYTIPELVPIFSMQKRAIRQLFAGGKLCGRRGGKNYLVAEQAL